MVTLLSIARIGALVAGTVLFGLAYRTTRRRDKPAADSFAVLLGVLGLTALCAAATAHTGTPYKLVWLYTGLTIPIALAFFAFDYYGIGFFASRLRIAAGVAPAAAGAIGGTVVVLGAPEASPGAAVESLAELPAVVSSFATALDQMGLYYTTGVMLLGVGLVIRTVYRYDHLDTRLGVVVAFVGIWPWVANLFVPQLSGAFSLEVGVSAVAGGYVVSALGAAVAVGPLDLFESSPMAGNVGLERVLDSMDDGVVVVDAGEHVLRMNAVACTAFGRSPAEVVGTGLADVVGYHLEALVAEGSVTIDTVQGPREFETTCSTVTDRTGRDRGYAVVFRDVTDRRTREQRLEVFNRVLRHNLRNDATNILGRAELISTGGAPEGSAEEIVDATRNLVRTAERAREIERMLNASNGPASTTVRPAIEAVVDEVLADYPDVEVTTALPDGARAPVDPVTFEVVFGNLLENGAQHNDADEPIVVVSGDYDEDGRLTIAVTDNGPGIPDHERAVLQEGGEDQLEHGSGLGLWAVNWGVIRMGGELSFSENDPRGATVTVRLPAETPTSEDALEEAEPAE